MPDTLLTITAADARRLLLDLAGLAAPPRCRQSADDLMALIERLGFVQIDSVNVVERAHHMILFARNQTYQPARLRRLAEVEGRLFEHWTHDAALVPTAFYPYWRHRFGRDEAALRQRFRHWHGPGFEADIERVLGLIEANGAVMARDLADGEGRKPGGWWEWHDGKTALEFLWRSGRLAIARREGFQKVYDLAERVIPAAARGPEVDHESYVDWACGAALERLGFATAGEIAGFWGKLTTGEAKAWCAANLGGRVTTVAVEGTVGGRPRRLFARADIAERVAAAPDAPKRMRVINPFDPILRDRKRLAHLFGFDYRIEIFVPAARRQYGYYVFPLLEGERLVGRIDMKADRAADTLAVAALWMEPKCRLTAPRRRRLEAELDRVRRFARVGGLRFADGWLKRDGDQGRPRS